uniref:Uncharacterized protein n=1 Tax=viral metagenome TaxID=1070528 RepID=A0A6M3L6F2_9ZZZZ
MVPLNELQSLSELLGLTDWAWQCRDCPARGVVHCTSERIFKSVEVDGDPACKCLNIEYVDTLSP